MGWSFLEKSQPAKALEHFREALRLEPESDWARRGIVEAMKARYFLYRIVLGWFLWMLRLPSRTQWGILIGAFVGYQVLRNLAAGQPQLKPFVAPLLIAYVAFALMTWMAAPLFNLLLRLNRFGRLALTREQIITSNWVGLCVLVAVLSLGGYFMLGDGVWLLCAVACALDDTATGEHLLLPHRLAARCPDRNQYRSGIAGDAGHWHSVGRPLDTAGASTCYGRTQRSRRQHVLARHLLTQFGVNALVQVRPRQGSVSNKKARLVGMGVLVLATVLFGTIASSRMRSAVNDVNAPKLFTRPIRAKVIRLEGESITQFTWPQMKWQSGLSLQRGSSSTVEPNWRASQVLMRGFSIIRN